MFTRIFRLLSRVVVGCMLVCSLTAADAQDKIPVLLMDGQNNHDWKSSSPWLKKLLEETGRFTVDVATSPASGQSMADFKPSFARYKVIVSNYNGEPWSEETRKSLVNHIRQGAGFVSVHAANNAFPEWAEYNEMIGVGGWGNRNEKSGPWLYWEGKIVRDVSPGRGGSHGRQHPFVMVTRDATHPIMKGLPAEWMHAKDELYDRLRGPARNLTVLSTAWSDPETGGTGKHEPLLMVIQFGEGRVFHTALGHNNGADLTSQKCVGFITTLQRGTEWAATGRVTLPVPSDFPTSDAVKVRP